jgi:CTP-dependent riboflavin kinase
MEAARRLNGVIFSDLGQASSFMALDWVQKALQKSLGFSPFPATLNLRPRAREDAQVWEAVQNESGGVPLQPVNGGFCSARLYRVHIHRPAGSSDQVNGAVLLPDVRDYPKDKIEIIAPMRLKEAFGVEDGDQLTLEFGN